MTVGFEPDSSTSKGVESEPVGCGSCVGAAGIRWPFQLHMHNCNQFMGQCIIRVSAAMLRRCLGGAGWFELNHPVARCSVLSCVKEMTDLFLLQHHSRALSLQHLSF